MLKIKLISIALVILTILGLGIWCGFKAKELNQSNQALNDQLMRSKLEVGKSNTELGDAQDKMKLLSKQLQDEIIAHQEVVDQYGVLLAKYNAKGGGTVNSTPAASNDPPVVINGQVFSPGKLYIAQNEDTLQPYICQCLLHTLTIV